MTHVFNDPARLADELVEGLVAANRSRIVQVDGREGPSNENRLCVKGRFGFDYVRHPHRLTQPLIRRDGVRPEAVTFW